MTVLDFVLGGCMIVLLICATAVGVVASITHIKKQLTK